jgi:small subunit ribosomal protein S20
VSNRARRATLKSAVRGVVEPLSHGETKGVADQLREAIQLLDREADRGLIHRNTAARKKSRLTKRLNAALQKPAK